MRLQLAVRPREVLYFVSRHDHKPLYDPVGVEVSVGVEASLAILISGIEASVSVEVLLDMAFCRRASTSWYCASVIFTV